MSHYQLQMYYDDRKVVDTTVAWDTYGQSHPCVGQTVDGRWRIIEVLENVTPELYRVRVEPIGFFVADKSGG